MPDLRVGIIGAGTAGAFHSIVLSNLPGVTVAALADDAAGADLAAEVGAKHYSSEEDMLAEEELHALVSAVSIGNVETAEERASLRICELSIGPDNRIPCLFERPPGLSLSVPKTISQVFGTEIPYGIGYYRRFGLAQMLKARFDSGEFELGNITSVLIVDPHHIPPQNVKPWRWDPDQAGELPVHYLVQVFDLLSYLFGLKASEVWAEKRSTSLEDRVLDTEWRIQLAFTDGIKGTVDGIQYPVSLGQTLSMADLYRIEVRGTGGVLSFDWNEATFVPVGGDISKISADPRAVAGYEEFQDAHRQLASRHEGLGYVQAEAKALAIAQQDWHFTQLVNGACEQTPLGTAEDASYALSVALAAQDSARSGDAITLS